jgi:hypothetical protein
MNVRSLTFVPLLMAAGCCCCPDGRGLQHAFTSGNILKHMGTEIVNPTNLTVRASTPPTLSFTASVGDRQVDLITDGMTVREGVSTDPVASTRPRYDFYISGRQLRYCRIGPAPQWPALATIEDVGTKHTPTDVEDIAFDLRPNRSIVEGPIVVAVIATTPTDPTPRKRLYKFDAAQLETKLP